MGALDMHPPPPLLVHHAPRQRAGKGTWAHRHGAHGQDIPGQLVHKAGALQVVLEDDLLAGVEDGGHVARVCGARDVPVNLLGVILLLVLGEVLRHNVLHTAVVVAAVLVVVEEHAGGVSGVGLANVHLADLVLEQVLLVQEQNDGGVLEPLGVADLVE